MLKINKTHDNEVINFAAEELKKYYRMMMPEEKKVEISTDPNAKEGFRLGLLEDFGLANDAKDPKFDDIIHIDADEKGGILAGSNPRSVLFAVYRFLKLNGCRWLFPGPEGEYIPMKKIEKQFYHKAADHRFRGHTLEGTPNIRQVLEYIDFHAKEELNAFGLYDVQGYQSQYYRHRYNQKNRPEEGFDPTLAETQWRAHYECEVAKRGQILFSGEHDLLPATLGLDVNDHRFYVEGKKEFPEEVFQYVALLNGERKFKRNNMYFTQLCYSHPEVQKRMVEKAVEIAKKNPHLDFYGITFADWQRNHCECEECKKSRPSDKYVKILNMIDEKLTEEGLDTKILFSFYTDMMFAPETEKIKNPDRFAFQYCPIYRSYTSSITEDSVFPEPIPYKYNDWEAPKSSEETMALFKEWERAFEGPRTVFEYHFWRKQYRDLGGMAFARRVYEDTFAYQIMNMQGCMEDGSNKSFFPNGFAGHIYAETLMNRDLNYEEELEDYYSHLYGEDWRTVKDYLQKITDIFDFKYMLGECEGDKEKGGVFYDPSRIEAFSRIKEITADIKKDIQKNRLLPVRAQSTAWNDLLYHAKWCEGISEMMIEKCQNHIDEALKIMEEFIEDFGKTELAIEERFDFILALTNFAPFVKLKENVNEVV